MQRYQEDGMPQQERNRTSMSKDSATGSRTTQESAATHIQNWPSPPENDADGAAGATSHRLAAGAASASPPQPPPPLSPSPRGLGRVEGTAYSYNLRTEIGRGAYGQVYLVDAMPHAALALPPPPPPQSMPHLQPSIATTTGASGAAAAGGGGRGRAGPRALGNWPGRMVLKQMKNASVEDGLQAATLREIMVLEEVSAGTAHRDRMERDAFRSGRAAFRPPPAGATSAASVSPAQEGSPSSMLDAGRHAAAEDEWDDVASSSSAPLCSGTAENVPAQLRRRVARGRQHLIGLRDTIMRPQEQMAYVAMGYCEGGDLWHFLRDLKLTLRTSATGKFGDAMPVRVFRRWAVELILALAFLHSHNIAHRDLKPQNMMLARRADTTARSSSSAVDSADCSESRDIEGAPAGERFTLKVGDFGLSRLEGVPYKKYVHEAVTLWYRSPDVLLGNTNYMYSADAWSLGCILVEMASGSVLFKGKDEEDELRHIFTRGCRPSPSTFPRMEEYHYAQRYANVLKRYQEADPPHLSAEELLQSQVERISRHLRAFLRERHSVELLGDAGVDLLARLLILDPERRLTIVDAMSHRFFTTAYAEFYGSD